MAHLLQGDSIGELYPKLLEVLLNSPAAQPRGQATREQLGMVLHCPHLLQNILVHPVRDLNYRFMVAEWLWIMAGRDDVATLVRYNKEYGKFSDDGKTVAGAYGPRLRGAYPWQDDQLLWCVQKFREDQDSRQAVATIWTPCPAPSKDVPCTVSLQFLLRQGKMHLIVTMRSSDAWLGLPYDWFTMTMIANCVAGELGVIPGSVTFQLGSSHLYEPHWEKAVALVATWQKTETVSSMALPKLLSVEEFNTILDPGFGKIPFNLYAMALHVDNKKTCLEILKQHSGLTDLIRWATKDKRATS